MTARPSLFLFAAVSLCGAGAAFADLSGRTEAGFVMARGNAETETANVKLELTKQLEKWKNTFGTSALYGRTSHATTAERWDARWQTEYRFYDGFFWFGALRYEDDRFSGFDYQGSASLGIGRAFIDTERTKLFAQIGAGYRRLRPEVLVRDEAGLVIDRILGEPEGNAVGNGTLKFEHALNDATRVLDSFIVESGADNTRMQNDLALEVKMTEVLALSLGLSVRRNSKPPEGMDKQDTLTTVNLVYRIE